MRKLHVIMPMAGEGLRFINEGYTTPKPLIKFKGIPLFQRAIRSLNNIEGELIYSFIVRQEHIDKFKIDQKIKDIYPFAHIYSVLQTTRGAVETCMFAEKDIDESEGIIVLDCDLEFYSSAFDAYINNILSKSVDDVNGGGLVSFNSDNPRYSYAELDKNGLVIRTAEKEVISNHALVGSYFFSKKSSFINSAKKLLNGPCSNKKEFYMSLLYNYLIKNHENINLSTVDRYYSYGTPEELKKNLDVCK